jgi:hypothetical protein
MPTFAATPTARFAGACAAVRRPQEIASFSYDEARTFRADASALRYYYPARVGADLSRGFERFEKLDDSADEHLDGLLRTLMLHEQEAGARVEADVVTWRGMMTKVRQIGRERSLPALAFSLLDFFFPLFRPVFYPFFPYRNCSPFFFLLISCARAEERGREERERGRKT